MGRCRLSLSYVPGFVPPGPEGWTSHFMSEKGRELGVERGVQASCGEAVRDPPGQLDTLHSDLY